MQTEGDNTTNQQSRIVRTDSNVSFPVNSLNNKFASTSKESKDSEIKPDASQAIANPSYYGHIPQIAGSSRQEIPGPPGLPNVVLVRQISEENDGVYRLNRQKIAGMVTMMAIINILYGSFAINPTCSGPQAAGGSCSAVIVPLVVYDIFGLVYLLVNIGINLIDAQRLDGYCLCLLTFKKNTREQCWHFGFGTLFALIPFIMCIIGLIIFAVYLATYWQEKSNNNEAGEAGAVGKRSIEVEVPQMSHNEIIR